MPAAALTGSHVLVLEDEFWGALELADILDRLGCRVLGPAATVADALRRRWWARASSSAARTGSSPARP